MLEKMNLVSVLLHVTTNLALYLAHSTHVKTAMAHLWRVPITVQTEGFVVGNVF
jgi:hypothetical protein